jgi:hypothetical protein
MAVLGQFLSRALQGFFAGLLVFFPVHNLPDLSHNSGAGTLLPTSIKNAPSRGTSVVGHTGGTSGGAVFSLQVFTRSGIYPLAPMVRATSLNVALAIG